MRFVHKHRVWRWAVDGPAMVMGLILAILTINGCALMQDAVDESLPTPVPQDWTTEMAIQDLPIAACLLDLIDAPPLEALVREAMEANPDLQATAMRLQASGFRFKGQRSTMLPMVNAGFSKGRNNQTEDSQSGEVGTADNHRVSLGLSWEIDLWGRLADQFAASRRDLMAQQADYRSARDALAARVIQAWIEQVANRRALTIEAERVAVLQDIEAILIGRYRDGIGSLDEYATARSRTQIALADQSVRQSDWHRSIRQLEVLVGRPSKGDLLAGQMLPAVTPVSVDTPAAVMHHRPDVRAAMNRLIAARRLSQSADKAMLPQLTLTGELFRTSARIGDIGSTATCWGILGSLFQPLFEGGRILSEARAAEAETDAALMDLRSVVLRALKEVENALDLERELAVQIMALERAVRESATSSRYYADRYRQGLDTIQNLLLAKEQEMAVKIRLNEVAAQRLSNRIDLALALGIGGDDETNAPEPT
jgi:NodT family efflux transporter outer membrane factor (OMF) lipoprotein